MIFKKYFQTFERPKRKCMRLKIQIGTNRKSVDSNEYRIKISQI